MVGQVLLTFCRKTGIASTTTAEERGSASIMYVSAREAWFIWVGEKNGVRKKLNHESRRGHILSNEEKTILTISKLCSICNSAICKTE